MATNSDWIRILTEIRQAKTSLSTISLLYDGDKEKDFDLLLGTAFDLFLSMQMEAYDARPTKRGALSPLLH